ncbi:MAG: hypothetical protein ACLGHP_05815, partial [Vicinamibacteria bacterium]
RKGENAKRWIGSLSRFRPFAFSRSQSAPLSEWRKTHRLAHAGECLGGDLAGAALLQKPFSTAVLVRAVRLVIDASPAHTGVGAG